METMLLIKFAISSSKLVGLSYDVTPDVCCAVAGSKPEITRFFLSLLYIFSVTFWNNISSSYRSFINGTDHHGHQIMDRWSFIYGNGINIGIKKISLKKRNWTLLLTIELNVTYNLVIKKPPNTEIISKTSSN